MLLYISIAGILFLVVSASFSLIAQTKSKSQTIGEVEFQGTQAMQIITQTIRNATAITTPLSGATSSALNLAVPSSAKNPTSASISGGQLLLGEGGSSAFLTSPRVIASNFVVSNYSSSTTPGSVRVQFILTLATSSLKNEYNYAKTFYGSASIR